MTSPIACPCGHNSKHTFMGCTFTWHECTSDPCTDPGTLMRCGCHGNCVHGIHPAQPVIVATLPA